MDDPETNKNPLCLHETSNIIYICCIAFSLSVLVPLCIYFMYQPLSKRRDILLQKRHINLSLLAIACLLIQMIAENMDALFDFGILDSMQYELNIIRIIISSMYFFGVSGFISVTFARFFLVYFDIKHNILIANNEWKQIIHHNHNENQTANFFIKYKSILGNEKFWIKFICIDLIITAIISPILANYNKMGFYYIHNALFYIAFIVIYIQLRRVKFWDDFFIITELRHLGKAIALIWIIWASLTGANYIVSGVNKETMPINKEIVVISYLFLVYVLSMGYNVFVVYICSHWVMKKLRNCPSLHEHYRFKSVLISQFAPQLSLSVTTSNSKRKRSESNPVDIKLKHILRKSDYLQCFIHHLSKELSLECILSFIEFQQFRQFVKSQSAERPGSPASPQSPDSGTTTMRRYDTELSLSPPSTPPSAQSDDVIQWKLPDSIPKSSIVYHESDDLETKARKLYEKYVKVGSEWEINIAGGLRGALQSRFEPDAEVSLLRKITPSKDKEAKKKNLEVVVDAPVENQNDEHDDLYHVFDGCSEAMVKLLRFSLRRFKGKPEFRKVLKRQARKGKV